MKKLLNIVLILSCLTIPLGYVYNISFRQIEGVNTFARTALLIAPIASVLVYAVGKTARRRTEKVCGLFSAILLVFILLIAVLGVLVARDTLALILTSYQSLLAHVLVRGGLNLFALLVFNESVVRLSCDRGKIAKRNEMLCIRNTRGETVRYVFTAPSYSSWEAQQRKCGVLLSLGGIVVLCRSIFAFSVGWQWLLVALALVIIGYFRFGAFEPLSK